MKKILVYPKYNNPYQKLLYQQFNNNKKIKINYLVDEKTKYDRYLLMFVLPFMIVNKRIKGFNIFHLHWVAFTPKTNNKIIRTLDLFYVIFILLLIKVINYKLVWTIHNITPHDCLTINDLFITRFLYKIADVKIVHSKNTMEELKELKINIKNVVIIPHGNYIEYYENKINKIQARKRLHLDKNAFVLLFFGEIKFYKGIDELLKTFLDLAGDYKNSQLLVVGKVYEEQIEKLLKKYKSKLKDHLQLFLQYIPDSEIQYYMNAADIVVYPFRKITTSGSVLLALSFGKPIIYPLIGSLKELPDNIGFSYSIDNENNLHDCLEKALKNKKSLNELGHNALSYAKKLSWNNIAKQTLEVYNNL